MLCATCYSYRYAGSPAYCILSPDFQLEEEEKEGEKGNGKEGFRRSFYDLRISNLYSRMNGSHFPFRENDGIKKDWKTEYDILQ